MKRKQSDDKQRTISSFFTAATKLASKPQQQVQRALQQPHTAESPHAKRRKPNEEVDIIEIDVDAASLPTGQEKQRSADAASVLSGTAVEELAAAIPAVRNHARHSKAQHKLVGAPGATSLLDPGAPVLAEPAANRSTAAGAAHGRKPQPPKYTPLEQQVVALKAAHPGVLLVVEVGYKMRFFGEDAQTAAQELGIYAYPDHNFLTASIPVQRLPIHVRRLVAAGHKVGVVRQVESAALKAASDNKSAPFTRRLTGLYTAATLDVGEKADKLGDASAIEASQELDMLLGTGSNTAAAAKYMLIIAEQQQQQYTESAGAAAQVAASSSSSNGTGLLGVLAVDVGSGDIAYGICSSNVSSSSSSTTAVLRSSSSSSSSGDGAAIPLEAVLLSVSPAEIVVCEPISAATNRHLVSYMAGYGGKRCRLERLQQQQQRPGSSSEAAAAAAGGADTSLSYLDAATLLNLQEFYGNDGSSSGSSRSSTDDPALPAAAAAATIKDCAAHQRSSSDDLQFILSLPHLVLQALAGAIQHLTAYNLAGVLKCTSGFRALGGVGSNMGLDGNALRQLEVLSAGGDGPQRQKGSLLHLIDRSATAAGGRLLRRWLTAPLADRAMIVDRQDAVAALLAAAGGGSSSAVLQRIPQWLASSKQDLERSLSRVAAGTASPAEAVGLWSTLAQLPKALQLPLQPGTQQPGTQQQLDLEALAAAVPSRLLVALLAAAASPAAVAAAQQVLSWLDVTAAAKNDYLALFKSQERFPEVFACAAAVESADSHLRSLLPQLAAAAGVSHLSYVSIMNQGDWMVELPAERTDIPDGWVKVCGTKKVCRYHPPEVKTGMAALARAQEQQAATAHAAWQGLLAEFSAVHHPACRDAVSAVAELDALHSLASLAAAPGYVRPEFVDDAEPQQLLIQDGKHPMLDLALDGGAVGNSLELKWDGVRAAIVTGPNMGGKSVLIRQAALTIILAQLGSWVPASRCRLSVFDGVFSRMGATDCLLAGRSTFAEELGDAAHILGTATNRSLVIMDELGRGTATHDGVAIATATLRHLVDVKQCLTLFVTHYPEVAALAQNSGDGTISSSSSSGGATADATANHTSVYHMAYVRHDPMTTAVTTPPPAAAAAAGTDSSAGREIVESSTAEATAVPSITFLYKLTAGAADASFGLNVAQMAGLPPSVVHGAATIAAQLKATLQAAPPPPHHDHQQQQQQQQQQQHKDHSEKLEGEVFQQFEQVVQQLQRVAKCSGCCGPQEQQQQQQVQQHEQQQAAGRLAEMQEQLVGLQRIVSHLLQVAE